MRAAGLPEMTFDVFRLGTEQVALAGLLRKHLEAGPELKRRLRTWAALEAENTWDDVAFLRQ